MLPLDFTQQGAMLLPNDRKLHDLTVQFCEKELAEEANLSKLQKVWVAVEMDNGDYLQVLGVTGYVNKIDVPLFRCAGIDSVKASTLLIARIRSFLEDNGLRGHEIFVHVSSKETPEQKCSRWKELLGYVKAKAADRWSVIV